MPPSPPWEVEPAGCVWQSPRVPGAMKKSRPPPAQPVERFSEKGFYLDEFHGRTLGIAAGAADLREPAPLLAVLAELAANDTRAVVISSDASVLQRVLGSPPVSAGDARLAAVVWRALGRAPWAGVAVDAAAGLAAAALAVAIELGLTKLVWIDSEGGLRRADGTRVSFVERDELRALVREGEGGARIALLREVERALDAGVSAVNLSTLDGLADELFTYAGSGTLFTSERYVSVRRLGVDDYDAAADLIARGVEEGYLAPRSPSSVDEVLASGFGAFVEGRYLAGIAALLTYPEARLGEIVSLYAITRFAGEGVGKHLVSAALERARTLGLGGVFACTTAERVCLFFERLGFGRVPPERLPPAKWKEYDAERRARLVCLLRDV